MISLRVGAELQYLYLEAAHISRVAGVLQTVLIAFQKELEEKSANRKRNSNQKIINNRILVRNLHEIGIEIGIEMGVSGPTGWLPVCKNPKLLAAK